MAKTNDAMLSANPKNSAAPAMTTQPSRTLVIVLLFIGIGIIAGARKGQMSQNAMTVTNILLGCTVIAGAALFYTFANNIATFVFSN